MAPTYLETLSAFTTFLTAYTHTLLYLRTLYPRTSFVHSRFHNTSVYQSRHPLVCDWIRDAIAAVRTELLAGSVARIAIVIFSYGNGASSEGSNASSSNGTGDVQILERFMLDVSSFPVVDKNERNMELEWSRSSSRASSRSVSPSAQHGDQTPSRTRDPRPLDFDVDINLSEQFRAALISLTTRCAQLSPLPENCSFNISMELKDEADVDPPLGHPQAWIPVQPSLQKTGRKNDKRATVEDEGSEEGSSLESKEKKKKKNKTEGDDLGGVRVTPIRTVEAGTFRFETWVEEGRAKFEERGVGEKGKGRANVSFSSSGD
jgi:mitotic spindle assembly checkpoint protein MAD2B